ncbi:glycoside hydrolase family 43 protein [Fibrella aquatilis]|uniref:Glycoside hydrolase family 43 protein n=1 Tax=Fibrella aquatilis TaxID=2817059 RepID=A0A939K299_9BACT|nr:glycoside hydrolase family 43 protein [Fibrella aquatilis]MBO0933085.1 glycoside hydrolase family 43 protein [Fibrella aquatilis]
MPFYRTTTLLCLISLAANAQIRPQPISQPLVSHIYTADPSAHVFNGKLYIYPSHDVESGIKEDDSGAHFDMRDYHILSMDSPTSKVTDHGVALSVNDIAWAGRQLWAPDAAYKKGMYYLYFPVKDKQDVFRIGVASSKRPEGPFTPEKAPLEGTYSIDPCVLAATNGEYYLYFGGIWGGQLQRWNNNTYDANAKLRTPDEPAILPRMARLSPDMKQLAEAPKEIQLLDETGKPFLEKDNDKRFFEGPWVHQYKNKYYFSYSTGDTHNIAYAIGDSPYGPFTYKGVVLKPVQGWTNHHSIVAFEGKWYLFYHDVQLSGKTHLRNIKVTELTYNPDGTIVPISAYK